MSLQKAGKRYENELVNELNKETQTSVVAHPLGYSGNHSSSSGDILITTEDENHIAEIKRTSQDRAYVADEEDMLQICRCANSYTCVYFGVKFSRRELMFEQITWAELPLQGLEPASKVVKRAIPPGFDPHITDGGRLRMSKPSTDEWPSASAGRDDVDVILDEIGVDL